ncbi:MAG: Ppx/GppA phosphatase family protein [Anaerolineales bacterium]
MYTPSHWKKRLGIIDLGSNSARLIIAQYTPGESFKITYEYSLRVRLAEGMASNETLQSTAIERAIETLLMFRDFCAANGVEHLIPVATAATRDAVNGREFLQRVRAVTGLRLRLLSGEEEAYYGALGVINGSGLRGGVVMDVGGGSAQVSVVRGGAFQRGGTTPLGAVRLTEQFLPGERATTAQIKKLNGHLDDTFENLRWMTLKRADRFIGLGGSIRTLARIDRDDRDYPLRLLNGYELRRDRLEALIDRIAALPVKERARKISGLPSDRADVILAGALVVAAALRHVGAKTLYVSDQGLREGLLYEAFLKPKLPVINDLRAFSVHNLARVYGYQSAHSEHVAQLAVALFDRLKSRHSYGPVERDYLWAAAQLNDIGTAVNYQDHHKHSAYLILSAGLPGYSHRETALIALLCLFHRKGKADEEPYAKLFEKGDGQRVRRLGAILRLAEALDSSRTQDVSAVSVTAREGAVSLRTHAKAKADVTWEAAEAQRNAGLFEEAFNCALTVKAE